MTDLVTTDFNSPFSLVTSFSCWGAQLDMASPEVTIEVAEE